MHWIVRDTRCTMSPSMIQIMRSMHAQQQPMAPRDANQLLHAMPVTLSRIGTCSNRCQIWAQVARICFRSRNASPHPNYLQCSMLRDHPAEPVAVSRTRTQTKCERCEWKGSVDPTVIVIKKKQIDVNRFFFSFFFLLATTNRRRADDRPVETLCIESIFIIVSAKLLLFLHDYEL